MLRKILIAIVTVAVVLYAFYLINSTSEVKDEILRNDSGFVNILKGKEFSAVAYYKDKIYAGGIQGLYLIDPVTFQYEELEDNGKAFKTVRAIYIDRDMLWVGHENGIAILGDGKNQRIGKEEGMADPKVIDIARADENTMYAATYSGVAKISDNGISYMTVKDGLPADTIKTILKDSFGWIWFGAYTSRGGGVVCKKGNEVQSFDIGNGLVHNCITSIVEMHGHKILVGGGVFTEGGANILEYTGEKWKIIKTIKKEDGLAGDKVRNIFIDDHKNIWFCSEYDGVAIFKENGEKAILTDKNGLSDNEVKKVVQDGDGNYWLATKNGITIIGRAFI